jgi:hypothetical protein
MFLLGIFTSVNAVYKQQMNLFLEICDFNIMTNSGGPAWSKKEKIY